MRLLFGSLCQIRPSRLLLQLKMGLSKKDIIMLFTGGLFFWSFSLYRVGNLTETMPTIPRHCSPTFDYNTIDVMKLTGPELIEYFLWKNDTACNLKHDFGGMMFKDPPGLDGQKSVCLNPVEIAPKAGKCIVYSFGINGDWSFDETFEKYGCKVYAFDPSMKEGDHNHTEGVYFYRMGVGRRDETTDNGWKLRTLSSIYKMLEDKHKDNPYIDYLKMDIEYDEWGVLYEMSKSGMLSKVRQLGVEIHLLNEVSVNIYRKMAGVVQMLEKKNGMIRFDSKYNPWFIGNFTEFGFTASFGYEIAWYNGQLMNVS